MTENCFNVQDVGFDPGNINQMLEQSSQTLDQNCPNIGWTSRVCWVVSYILLRQEVLLCRIGSFFVVGTVSKAVAQH